MDCMTSSHRVEQAHLQTCIHVPYLQEYARVGKTVEEGPNIDGGSTLSVCVHSGLSQGKHVGTKFKHN